MINGAKVYCCSSSRYTLVSADPHHCYLIQLNALTTSVRSSLQAIVQDVTTAIPQAELLCACQCCRQHDSQYQIGPALCPDIILALFKSGDCLQLYALQSEILQDPHWYLPHPQPHSKSNDPACATTAEEPAAHNSAPTVQLLAEFRHERFAAGVQSSSCSLLPGPVLLLQPHPEQLLCVAPTRDQRAHGTNTSTASITHGPNRSECSAPNADDLPAWNVVQLDLTAEELVDAAVSNYQNNVSAVFADGSSFGPSTVASWQPAGHWQLLHSSTTHQDGTLQLLLSQPIACAADAGLQQHQHSAWRDQQQGQQEAALLCLLQVNLPCTDVTGSDQADIAVIGCRFLSWQASPVCAAAWRPCSWHDSCKGQAELHGTQQLIAVGSEAGDLCVLSIPTSPTRAAHLPAPHQQPSMQQVSFLSAVKQVSGFIQEIVHLRSTYAAGTSQCDVLAVLHREQECTAQASADPPCTSMTVTLVKLQGQRLHQLTKISGVLGLSAPAHSALGLVCPPLQQQQEHMRCGVDGTVQLAAVLFMDNLSSDQPGPLSAVSGLPELAWIDAQQAKGLPGKLLGLVAGDQACFSPPHPADAQAGSSQGDDDTPHKHEMQGLLVARSTLERCWQRGAHNLCTMQHRVVIAQQISAAAHQQLCQAAADTFSRCGVQQYTVPPGATAPKAALAAYNAGRQRAQHASELMHHSGNLQASASTPSLDCAGRPPVIQLRLQFEGVRTSFTEQGVAIEVAIEPTLAVLQLGDAATSHSRLSWGGALLQPFHAELLLWHTGSPAVTVTSTWRWDPITGRLHVTATVGASLLLQIHSYGSGCSTGVDAADMKAAGEAASCSNIPADGVVHVAAALCMAAERVASGKCCSATRSSAHDVSLELQAAVAVSAGPSKQAIAQWEGQQLGQHQELQRGTAALQGLLPSLMLQPAYGLLHLPPVLVSVGELLMHQLNIPLASPRPSSKQEFSSSPHSLAQDVAAECVEAAAVVTSAQTPTCKGLVVMSLPVQSGPQVVPPTPCSVAGTDAEGIIPDSQEEEDGGQQHELDSNQQQFRQWLQSQRQQQHLSLSQGVGHQQSKECCDTGVGEDVRVSREQPASLETESIDKLHARHLLLHASPQVLQQLEQSLQRMLCCHLMYKSSGKSSGNLHDSAGVRCAFYRVEKQQQQRQQQSTTGSVELWNAPAIGVVELTTASAREVHVALYAVHSQSLDLLEQLLLHTLNYVTKGLGGYQVLANPASRSALGCVAVAAATLTESTFAHVSVLQRMLQQLHHSSQTRLRVSLAATNRKAAKHVEGTSAARSLAYVSNPPCCEPEEHFCVASSDAAPELAACWLACLCMQAEMDLTMAQLQL